MLSDTIVSFLRTWTPVLVGSLLTWLGDSFGIILEGDPSTALVVGVTGLVIALYYGLVRILESRWPWFGVLLGSRKQPAYDGGGAPVAPEAGRARVGVAVLLAMILALPAALPALAHSSPPALHHSCGTIHSLTYDGYSGGKYWYHSVMRSTSLWPWYTWKMTMDHYYRSGPPSNPVYIYDHSTAKNC